MQQVDTLATQQRTANILGVRFDCLPMHHVVEQILHWIAEGSRRMVITAGPEFVMKVQQDDSLRKLAFVADMVTPDGVGIVWAARRQGLEVHRVTGVELGEQILATAVERKIPLRVFVLGAAESSLQQCMEVFRDQYPGIVFRGHHGYFDSAEWDNITAELTAFQPHLWLVGLGQPRQEKLIYQALGSLPPCVAIGVGGSIDVWGNTVRRAPRIIQRIQLEWLYRLLKEPSRWRRQLALPRFAWKVIRNQGRPA